MLFSTGTPGLSILELFFCCLILLSVSLTRHTRGDASCSITGVTPSDCPKYKPDERIFYCGGKENKRIPMKFVNDDYCDCQETGADEPGTAACINGRFYCNNKGFRGKTIFASWVNDGICDCCDGSDEWETTRLGRIKCPNTCRQLANEELAGVRDQKKQYEQGLQVKLKLVAEGNTKIQDKKREMEELQRKIDELQTKEQILKTKKESLEEKERNYRDELRKKKQEEDEAKRKAEEEAQAQQQPAAGGEGEVPVDGKTEQQKAHELAQKIANDVQAKIPPLPKMPHLQDKEKEENTDDAGDEKGAKGEKDEKEVDHEFPYPEEYRYKPKDGEGEGSGDGEEEEEYFPYPEEYRYHGDDEDGGDGKGKEDRGDDGFDWSEFEDEDDVFGDMPDRDEQDDDDIPYDPLLDDMTTAANTARDEWRTVDRELRDLKRDLTDHEQYTELDFGNNNEFASLYDECFSKDINKYTYEFCPFDKAHQKEKHSSVKLGKFTTFSIGNNNDPNSKTVMMFEKGQSCWQGPARSLKVIFECSSQHDIESVSEPSTCTYEMIFKTPLACRQVDIDRLDHVINNQFKQEL